jgi:hypothetical protein
MLSLQNIGFVGVATAAAITCRGRGLSSHCTAMMLSPQHVACVAAAAAAITCEGKVLRIVLV